jgi:SH3-like domain-containing protein
LEAIRKVRIRSEYRVQYPDPITLVAGAKVRVEGEDDEFPGWKWCRATDDREGWVPAELLSAQGTESIILRDYSARELSVLPGEEVAVEEERRGWLLVRKAHGERGWIPASHAEPLEP